MRTAMELAFVRAGGPDANAAALMVAMAKFQNNGGAYDAAKAILDAAYEMEGAGRIVDAERATILLPDAFRRDDDGEGHCRIADEAMQDVPFPPSPPSGGEGHQRLADQAICHVPPPAAPDAARQGQSERAEKATKQAPSAGGVPRDGAGHHFAADKAMTHVPRPIPPAYLAAARKEAKAIARTVLDSFKVRDGRAIGDLAFHEIEALRAANVREASVFRQIQKHVANADPWARVRDLIKAEDLERMIQRAAEVSDAS
jgi:hypothetical protein